MMSQTIQTFASLGIRLGVIGLGVMGGAIIRGLIRADVLKPEAIWGTDRLEKTCQKAVDELGIQASTQYQPWLVDTQVILLSVKPQQVAGVLKKLQAQGMSKEVLILSIAAGVTIAQIEEAFPEEALPPVIRVMPNTPCVVGEGMTVLGRGTRATDAHGALAHAMFSTVGDCMALDETYFDAVTSLCGSGPAFLYTIIEALADGGVKVGLPRKEALRIVAQTVLGAATMVQKTGRHPASLRDDVTTPAGCTIAGLFALEEGRIRSTLARAVEQATQVASGLGKLR
ncbi:MAG: pyrroline-5-carboxylate reductase [Vampirovibrionales bacterium]